MGENLASLVFPSGITPLTVSGGWYHVGITSTSGRIFMWGYNGNGQLVRKDIPFKCLLFYNNRDKNTQQILEILMEKWEII